MHLRNMCWILTLAAATATAMGQVKLSSPVEYTPNPAPKSASEPANPGEEAKTQGALMGYLVGPLAIAQTPRHLGVNTEIFYYHDRVNLWDWLSDSGASLVRLSDVDFRRPILAMDRFKSIRNRADFDAWRSGLLENPEKNLPWGEYKFDKAIPWFGVPDGILQKMKEAKVGVLAPVSYLPARYPVPLLKVLSAEAVASDDQINWDAAASAYEYCLAEFYHFASRYGVSHFMMLNEPPNDEKFVLQCGVIARMARLAFEDVRAKLTNKQLAADLFLGGPGHDIGWERYWKLIHPYVDAVDFHVYNPDQRTYARKYPRLEMMASLKQKKTAISEFNRIPGPTQPDQSLFSIRASLQLADIIMTLLSVSRPEAPGFEYAMLYQFSFPATHRSYKSLIYGDTNLMDWTGTDRVTMRMASELEEIAFESMQLRHPTPAYHIFKMLSRCVPGGRNSSRAYEVLPTGESDRGMRPGHNAAMNQAVFSPLEPKKYFAVGGESDEVRTLAIRGNNRLYFMVLNQGPAPVRSMSIDLDLLPEKYATAIVRETSQLHRDEAMKQIPVSGKQIVVDVPPESLVQVIFIKEDLSKISELKLEEITTTPGSSKALKLYETTLFRTLGKMPEGWIDLSDLNVVWTSSSPELVKAYQGGLIQRVHSTGREIAISAKTLNGVAAETVIIPPDEQSNRPPDLIANGGFEVPASPGDGNVMACRYEQDIRWELQPSPAAGWVASAKNAVLRRSNEQNHTDGGKFSMKLEIAAAAQSSVALQAQSFKREGFELSARRYRVRVWVYRPATSGLALGRMELQCEFSGKAGSKTTTKLVAASQDLQNLPTDRWVQLEGSVTAPVDSSNMIFSVNVAGTAGQTGVLYLDDVVLKPEFNRTAVANKAQEGMEAATDSLQPN